MFTSAALSFADSLTINCDNITSCMVYCCPKFRYSVRHVNLTQEIVVSAIALCLGQSYSNDRKGDIYSRITHEYVNKSLQNGKSFLAA